MLSNEQEQVTIKSLKTFGIVSLTCSNFHFIHKHYKHMQLGQLTCIIENLPYIIGLTICKSNTVVGLHCSFMDVVKLPRIHMLVVKARKQVF